MSTEQSKAARAFFNRAQVGAIARRAGLSRRSFSEDGSLARRLDLNRPRAVQMNRPCLHRLADRFGNRFSYSRRSPTRDCFPCENGERVPNQTEGDEMAARERFVIKE